MKITLTLLPYILLAIWLVYSIIYIGRARKNPEKTNKYIFESLPQVFPTIGILGTFIGIAYGLWYFDVNNIEGSIPELLRGLKTAFLASIGGIVLLIVFSNITAIVQKKNEEKVPTDELIALHKLVELIAEMRNEQMAVVPEMKAMREEIKNLGVGLQNMNTEMTQAIVKELYNVLNTLIDDFKISMSTAQAELEVLTRELGKTGSVLFEVTPKLQEMATKINEGFDAIQEMVKKLLPSNNLAEQIQAQLQEMNYVLAGLQKSNVSVQQLEKLMTIESKINTMFIQLQSSICRHPRFHNG